MRLRRAAALTLALALTAAIAFGQNQPPADPAPQWVTSAGGKLSFEIASVKQNKGAIAPGNFPNTNFPWGSTPVYLPNGGHLIAKNMDLLDIISFAYKLTGQQTNFMLKPALPSWALDDRFDIEARAPQGPEPTKDQMRVMMQSLLADRFQLRLHFVTKEGTVHALRLIQPGVLGPDIKPHPAEIDCSRTWYDPQHPDFTQPTDGLPSNCSYIQSMRSKPEVLSYAARGAAISEISKMATVWYNDGRPVLDETGLKGIYDFKLEFSPPIDPATMQPANPVPGATGGLSPQPRIAYADQHGAYGPELTKALKNQLGMKLENTKGPVQTLVLDHLDHPSSN